MSQDSSPFVVSPIPVDYSAPAEEGDHYFVDSLTPAHKVIADDVTRLNSILTKLNSAWAVAEDIKDICALANTTAKVIELRRKALLLPFGAPGEAKPTASTRSITPFDD